MSREPIPRQRTEAAYREGYDARVAGKSIDAVPYDASDNRVLAAYWRAGYHDADIEEVA